MKQPKYKVGDRVKLTDERFSELGGSQGYTNKKAVYTVKRTNGPNLLWLTGVPGIDEGQAHGPEHVLPHKPTIIIVRK